MTTEKGKKLLYYGSLTLLFAIIFGYGIARSRDLLFGIKVTTSGITDGMSTTTKLLTFGGVASHAIDVTVDGQKIPLAQNGTWTDTIALMPGYNVITLVATDKFKRTTTQTYKINYNAPLDQVPILPAKLAPTPPTNNAITTKH